MYPARPYTWRMTHAHPFGLSTAWNGARHQNVTDLLDEHQRLGFRRLEPYCHWAPDQLAELAREARAAPREIGRASCRERV